ncbi:unnamed protein product [Closterium sp. NIES-65]|nr:unnamed protein product [Closterium sp. NIES-65]
MEMFAVLFKLVLPNTRISRILFPSKLQGAHSSYVSTPCRYYVPSASSLRLRPPSPLPTLRSLRTPVPPPHSAMSFAATAATLRRELQQQRARQLYRRSLKNTLSWAIFRDIYYDEASAQTSFLEGRGSCRIPCFHLIPLSVHSIPLSKKATFPFFRLLLLIVPSLPHFRLPLSATPPGQSDPDRIDRLLAAGEAKLKENQHPDPYLVPWVYGGSKYARNPPFPQEISIVHGFGKEEH